LQAGGHRFDPVHLHHLRASAKYLVRAITVEETEVRSVDETRFVRCSVTSLRGSISLDVEVGVGRHAVRVAWWYGLAGENGVPWTGDAPCTGRRVEMVPWTIGSLRDEKLIKCQKGVWWMPWCQEAMKDVVRCDKLRGAANGL
jgi:hypothetical protein